MRSDCRPISGASRFIITAESLARASGVGAEHLYQRLPKIHRTQDRQGQFVVTPNNVTIDAYGSFDVTAEPVVVFVPTLSEQRWYIVQIGDSFDEIVRNIGGTKGPQPGVYVITGPDFTGDVPGEMIQIKSRTKIGVAAVRILANGAADLPKAVEAQKGFHLMPLSAYLRYGLAYKAPAERPQMALVRQQGAGRHPLLRRTRMAMGQRLSASADSNDALVASFRQIGLSVGNGFAWQTLDEADQTRPRARHEGGRADRRQQMGGNG